MTVIRHLFDSYTRQKMAFSWSGHTSRSFGVSNGVKQGGVLSPILFIVYFDTLICRLQASGLGCHFGNNFVGALGYADDITILAPSIQATNKMLNICEDYATEFNVTFNAKKTVAITFGMNRPNEAIFSLNGNFIKCVDQVKHLGSIVNYGLNDSQDCDYKRSCFLGAINKLQGNFGKMYSHVKVKLFRTYCCAFYGSQLWNMADKGFLNICTQWNKGMRKMLGLHYQSHRWLLGPISSQTHISQRFNCKWLRFFTCILNSTNEKVTTYRSICQT